jgi:hypothetical protein
MFMAKGGGSANKTFLYQQTKALLNEKSLLEFAEEKIKSLGTSACPPYVGRRGRSEASKSEEERARVRGEARARRGKSEHGEAGADEAQ